MANERNISIDVLPVGELAANCYLVARNGSSKVVCIDPGAEGEKLLSFLKDKEFSLEMILLTHAHVDHIGLQPYLCEGAQDNASGSIIIMGAAKALATSGYKPRRTIVFTLFGGEETGLIGPCAYSLCSPAREATAVRNPCAATE